MSEQWQSIALWPESVKTGRLPNESIDTHATKEAAEAVCRGLMREGLGGERKVFPFKVRVAPTAPPAADTGTNETKRGDDE